MMNDILDEIRAAEKEADELMIKAAEDAKQAVITADEECRKIKETTIKAVKEEKFKIAEAANKEGTIRYNKIVAAGKVSADRLIKDTDITPAVEFIKEKMLLRYVNS